MARHGVRFYEVDASDPDWLRQAAAFHGHLGPWVAVGAVLGHDAVERLQTPGQWKVEVICWMPPAKQQPPHACILDGLQATTGATMGKCNLRFAFDPAVVTMDQPVVWVVRLAEGDRPAEGLAYRMGDRLAGLVAGMTPDRLEAVAREIVSCDPAELFEVTSMGGDQIAAVVESE